MNDNDTIKLNIDTGNSITNLTNIYERLNQLNVSFQNLSNKNVNLKVNINENINESKEKIKNFFNIIKNFEEEKKIPKIISEKFIQQLQSIERDTNRYVDNINKALKKINEGNLSEKQLAFQKGNITLNTNKVNQLYSEDNLKKIEISVLNIKNIVDQNIKLSKQQDEFNKRQSIQEQESLKTKKEIVQYQRELNELQKIELQNNKLQNELNVSGKQIAKISNINVDKQTNLGLAKLNVSNIEALSKEQNDNITLRLKLQKDLNKALKDQLNIERDIIKEEKYINKQYDKEQAIYVKEDEKIRKKEEAIYRQYLKEEDRKKKVEIGKDVGYNKYIQKEEDRRYAEEEAIYRQYLKEEDRKTKELNKKIKKRKKLLAKSSKNALSLKEIEIDTPILQEQLHNLIKSAPQSMQALISTSSPLYQSPLKFSSQNITNKFEKFSKEELKAEQVKASSNYIHMSSTDKLNIEQQIQNALKEKIKIIEKELALNNKIEKKHENIVKEINKATKEQEKENENINKLLLLEKEINVLLENRSQHPKYYSGAKQDKADNYIQEIQKLQQQSNIISPQEQLKIGEKLLNLLRQEDKLIKDEVKEQKKYNDLLKNTKSITEEILNKEKTYKGKIKENKIVQEIQEKVFTPIRTDYKKINLDIKNQKQLIEGSSFNLLTREEQLKELEIYKTLLKEKLKITKNIEDQVDIIIKNHSKERIKIEKQAEEEKIKQLKIFEEEKEKIRKKGLTFQLTGGDNAQEYKKGGMGEGGWRGSGWVITGGGEKKNIVSVGNIDFGSMGNKRQISYINRQENLLPSNKKDEEWLKQADQVKKNINKTKQARAEIQKQFDIISGYSHQSFQSITTDINLAGNALNLFGQSMKAVGMSALEEAGTWEILRNKLATFTNSAEEAHERFQEIVKLGLKTPFEVKGLIQAEILLRSFGNNAKALLPKVVDLASAMGKDVDKAAYAVARAMSGASLGFLMLQKTWGVSYSKLKELGAEFKANGQIMAGSLKTQNALALSLDTLSGSAERLSRTYKGQLSNLQDSIDVLKESAGKTLLPLAKELTDKMMQLVQVLNNIPGPVKQFVVSIAGVGGAAALAVGGIFNFTWQLGNFAQGLTAAKSVLPGFIKEFRKIGTIMGFASKGTKALSAEMQIMKATIPGAFPALLGLRNVFMGAGAAGVAGAGGVAAFTAALGPILLIGAAVAGTIYLITKALQAYEKQKQQAKDDELALREINRRTILAELDSKLHDVNNSQDAYNKLMDKGAIEVAMMADSEKIFTQALQLQNMEIQDQEKRVEVLKQKWIDAINAKNAYEQGKLEEKELKPGIRKTIDAIPDMNMPLPEIPSFSEIASFGKNIVKSVVGLVVQDKQSPEEKARIEELEKRISQEREKEITSIRNELNSPNNLFSSKFNLFMSKGEEEYINKLKDRLKILEDEKYVRNEINRLNEEHVKTVENLKNKEKEILEEKKRQSNEYKYQQKEVANLISAYGPLLPAIQNIIDLQKQKQGIRPEVVNAIIGNLEAEKGKLKIDTTFDEENFYRKYKAKERAFATETGHNPGEIIFEDNKNFTDEQRKKAQEEAKKRAQDELDKFNVEAGLSSVSKITPERFAEIQDQLTKRDIIDKNLTTYKAFRPEDRWGSFKKLEGEAGKHLISKDAGEREKYSKSLQESFDENFKLDWDEFNAKEEEALGKNEITQKQHLNNLEKFISSHGERLKKYNPAKYGQLWDDFNKAREKFNKEEYKNSLNMQKDIAKAQDNKKQEIELTKRLELFALEEEYNERVKFAGKSVELDKWYYNQKREIEQKAHEDTIKELQAEYEERVALIGRAEVAAEKLGTFGEKRAKENERFLNEQANADVAYMEQKRDLEKRLDGATLQEKSILYQNLNNLDKSYIAEKQKRYEEHLLNLKQLALDELKSRAELASATSEHRHKTAGISDSSYIQEQKTITQGIVNELRDEAMIYEKMVIKGQELNEVQKNILTTYQQQEEKLLGLNQLAMEQLISRKGMMDSLVEHNKKMGESTDLDLLKQQKKSTEDILRANKTLADTYKIRLISGQQLTDTEFNILNTYNQQEEKLKEINTTLEYRLNKEGQIYDIAHKTFEDKLNLAISEKQITEDIANAQRAIYIEKQIEFEKEKLALLERKELTGKITDAEREILSIMRQRKAEHANLLSNISGFNDKVRNAVSQAAILSYELKHGADVTGVMSDKFKSAYEYAKSLLEQVKTIGNITAAGNSYGTMGEFSSLEDMVKSQGKFGANKDNAAKWKAELTMKHDMGNKDEADPIKAGREELEKQRAELQKRLESGRETESVMKSLNEEIKYLDKQLVDGLANQSVQTMDVTATTVNVNGEESGGNKDNEKGIGGGGGTVKTGEGEEVGGNYSEKTTNIPTGQQTTANNITAEGSSTIKSGTEVKPGLNYNTLPVAEQQALQESLKLASWKGRGSTSSFDDAGNYIQNDPNNLKTVFSITKRKTGLENLAETTGIYGKGLSYYDILELTRKLYDNTHENPVNDRNANLSGQWAIKKINKSVGDYTLNFLKGMVSQSKDNLKALSSNQYSNYNNQRSSKTENNYTINVDGRQTNISNGNNQRIVRDFVSLSLAGKTLR